MASVTVVTCVTRMTGMTVVIGNNIALTLINKIGKNNQTFL